MTLKFNKDILSFELKGCCPGSTTGYNYTLALDKDGHQYLEAEEFDQQAIIDSYADECSIERILISHGLGDEVVLNKKPGVYLDKEAIETINLSKDTASLNVQLFNLYQGYKDVMSFEDFSNAVMTGKFELLEKKPEEVHENE